MTQTKAPTKLLPYKRTLVPGRPDKSDPHPSVLAHRDTIARRALEREALREKIESNIAPRRGRPPLPGPPMPRPYILPDGREVCPKSSPAHHAPQAGRVNREVPPHERAPETVTLDYLHLTQYCFKVVGRWENVTFRYFRPWLTRHGKIRLGYRTANGFRWQWVGEYAIVQAVEQCIARGEVVAFKLTRQTDVI